MMPAGFARDAVAHVGVDVNPVPPRDLRYARTATIMREAGVALRRPMWIPVQEVLLGAMTSVEALHAGLRGKGVQLPADDSVAIAATEAGTPWRGASCAAYDIAFGIKRYERLTHDQQVLGAIPVIEQVLPDLDSAAITLDDRVNLMLLMSRIIGGYDESQAPEQRRRSVSPTVAAFTTSGSGGRLYTLFKDRRRDPLQRWRLGHRLYAHANRRAARVISQASRELHSNAELAASLLVDAAVEIVCITASMQYAAALSAEEYAELVRPTMRPPVVAEELTGAMNLDHQAYRRAVGELLASLGDGLPCHPGFREALDLVLGVDLADLEAHVLLTQRLVGRAPALDQNDHASAVASLRTMLYGRVRRYGPFLARPPA